MCLFEITFARHCASGILQTHSGRVNATTHAVSNISAAYELSKKACKCNEYSHNRYSNVPPTNESPAPFVSTIFSFDNFVTGYLLICRARVINSNSVNEPFHSVQQ